MNGGKPHTRSISVVINTLNEEANLPYAIGSVRPWADEIVVVDMHSDDGTAALARELGARVFLHERMGFADPAREFAIAQTTGDWVLILDADELVPLPLSRRLREIGDGDEADVVLVPKLAYLLGEALHRTGWGLDQGRLPLFFRRGFLHTGATVHAFLHPVPNARVIALPARAELAIAHFNYLDLTDFIERLNRYTSIEAEQAIARGSRPRAWKALAAAARELVRRYLRQGGWRDGWRGLYLSLFMAFYRIAIVAKQEERARVGPRQTVEAHYREEKERLLRAYTEEGSR